jgi:hypothetical protein
MTPIKFVISDFRGIKYRGLKWAELLRKTKREGEGERGIHKKFSGKNFFDKGRLGRIRRRGRNVRNKVF